MAHKNPSQHKIVWGRIEKLMNARGWKQADLARASKIPTANISRWHTGQDVPSLGSLVTLAKALGVTVDYLATGNRADLNEALSENEEFRQRVDLELKLIAERKAKDAGTFRESRQKDEENRS